MKSVRMVFIKLGQNNSSWKKLQSEVALMAALHKKAKIPFTAVDGSDPFY
jgi:hypothetical protein